MTAVLRSYVSGKWTDPADDGKPVLDAVTGGEVARVSSAGIDMGAALDYGRSAGGPALRELTFHQRAALLKSLGMALREHRQELYALSARTGATLADSKFDIDGGIGVLLSYASLVKRELPNDTVLPEGPVQSLGRGGTFVGQHILTPLHGVAVQINAFNFPVWGPLEKFAPAFIAGVPTLVKPATQTAYLTARLVELIVDSGLLPAGSLQLVCGSAGDLLDHLGEQDLVSFTGSAATAQRRPPGGRQPVGAVQRRGGLAELLGPRPRCRTGHTGIRPVRGAAGQRDDGQGRPEMHRDPAGPRSGRGGGPGGRGCARPAGRGDRRQPGRA
jgi:oxepin-CoA hydrolase/3-oxo-5,6-dehydrosuberyl-CoA semialdehyde dehydrogenase